MYEGVDTVILYEELAYQDIVPFAWRPLASPLSGEQIAWLQERNLRVLQACAALEEHGQLEKADENSRYSADLLRLDMKMNLLLDLVGRILVANQPRPEPKPIRFNAQGATWRMVASELKPGDDGMLSIYLKDCLIDPLQLIGRVASAGADGQIKAKFHYPGEAVADLIEKLAFRNHRRQVADSRQARVMDPARTAKARK